MLVEIRCDRFRTGVVSFQAGLNVVLGDENATNSIGKSTLLMVIDFGFGGGDLLTHNTDLVSELGEHDYFFSFRFEDEVFRFRRGTFESDVVYACDAQYEPVRAISVDEYTAFLKQSYHIDLPDLSFRALVGLYARIWGKENLSVDRPLHIVPAQNGSECVNTLLKTYRRYDTIRDLSAELASAEAKSKAINAATRQAIIPSVGKRQYTDNQKRISALEAELADIRDNLAKYATNLSAIVNRDVLELKFEKDRLLSQRLTLTGRLQRIQANLRNNRHVRRESFRELIQYFPDVDQGRLARVEEFHNDVARLLKTELEQSANQLEQQLGQIDLAIRELDDGMASTLSSVEDPGLLVDTVYEVASELEKAKKINERYENNVSIRDDLQRLWKELTQEKQKVLSLVQNTVNDGMRRIVTSAFGEDRKSPHLSLRGNGYTFEVNEDTGTGTAYTSLIVFDLTILLGTILPFIVHDTILFKNIENDSVAALLRTYLSSQKQSFIALDEVQKYGSEVASLLRGKSAIELSDDQLLYVKDWRTKPQD